MASDHTDGPVGETSDSLAPQAYLPLKGRKLMVTAGPTIEPIDPVRYISNHSSGKMGYALAEELNVEEPK